MTFVITVLSSIYAVIYLLTVLAVLIQIHEQGTDYADVFYSLGIIRTALFLISAGWLIFA